MKKVGLFLRWIILPLFIVFFGFGSYYAKDFKSSPIVYIILIALCVLYMFNSFRYSEECIEKNFFKKKIYYLNEIILVRKSTIGFYDFASNNINLPKISINFLFQKKDILELVEYIKRANPDCVIKI
ncbi:MAG: hypothetical protein J5631_07465 [Spirochaetaceae bacterium]|nr:hypothetical protein [Spirochaetaceae bacterium]